MAEAATDKNMDTTSQPKPRPKTSVVWENFTKTEKDGVRCNICKTQFVWHGSTTMMREHLKRKHVFVTLDGGSGTSADSG